MNILVVRLGALGDIVHAVPAVAALRAALPEARIDWLVDARHRAVVDLVTVLDRVITLNGRSIGAWVEAIKTMRARRYDVALDLQGLMKSAVLARASGAARVIGFSIWHLREKGARPFYSETDRAAGRGSAAADNPHVVFKNLHLLRVLGVATDVVEFPLAPIESTVAREVAAAAGGSPFAVINPGAAWPNKRWDAERYGAIASFLREVRGLRSIVLWGPGEEPLAAAVVGASHGAAQKAPSTSVTDVIALSRAASLVISGDTGPLHLAAASGAPVVGIFGPTDPCRNGPWAASDVAVSRFASCHCHYQRRCHAQRWCLAEVGVAEVSAAVQQRLGPGANAGTTHV